MQGSPGRRRARGGYAHAVPASLRIGLAFETPGTYARAVGDPVDYAAEVRVLPHRGFEDAAALRGAALPAPFPLFVKPRWEGTSKDITAGSRCEDDAALARAVDRITADYRQPALVEAFAPGAEYAVTIVGKVPLHAPSGPGREGDDYVVRAWDGQLWREPNPTGGSVE